MTSAPQSTSRQQTTQQRRAAHAWSQVSSLDSADSRNEYGSLVRGLPAMIQTDGLGQTLAFLLAKAKNDPPQKSGHKAAYLHLQSWLDGEFGLNKQDLFQWLLQQSSGEYRHVTSETQSYLVWLKRFVEAKNWKASDDG